MSDGDSEDFQIAGMKRTDQKITEVEERHPIKCECK